MSRAQSGTTLPALDLVNANSALLPAGLVARRMMASPRLSSKGAARVDKATVSVDARFFALKNSISTVNGYRLESLPHRADR